MITVRSYLNDETIKDHENVAAFYRVAKKSDCHIKVIPLRSHSVHGQHITVAWNGPIDTSDATLIKLAGGSKR